MTYEEKYNQAISVIKTIKAANKDNAALVDFIEYNYPELKEAEDERIRKVLIEHFEGSHSSMFPYKGFTKEQIIAWLEKQGEQKPSEREEKLMKCLQEANSEIGKLVEENFYLEEQKPIEWSEEDYSMLARIMFCLKSRVFLSTIDIEEIINWLKSLKDKVRLSIDKKSIPSKEFVLNVWVLGNEWKDITKGVSNTEYGTQLDYILKHWKEGEYYGKI